MANSKLYEIVYDSDFIIDDPIELSTLCVFYDKVYLPYCRPLPKDAVDFDLGDSRHAATMLENRLDKWNMQCKVFYDEGILRRCGPVRSIHLPPERSLVDRIVSRRAASKCLRSLLDWDDLFDSQKNCSIIIDESINIILGSLLDHLYRSDITSQQRFSSTSLHSFNRKTFETLFATKAFQYILPRLNELHPEQVLEVRQKIADLREGFSMHLQTLTADIDAQVKGGENADEIARYAQSVVETKLVPQYVEFKRQLGSIHAGMGRSVLSAGGSLYVAGSLFSQAHYVEALIAFLCGGALVIPEMLKDSLSNERQAYQFMRIVEDTVDR